MFQITSHLRKQGSLIEVREASLGRLATIVRKTVDNEVRWSLAPYQFPPSSHGMEFHSLHGALAYCEALAHEMVALGKVKSDSEWVMA